MRHRIFYRKLIVSLSLVIPAATSSVAMSAIEIESFKAEGSTNTSVIYTRRAEEGSPSATAVITKSGVETRIDIDSDGTSDIVRFKSDIFEIQMIEPSSSGFKNLILIRRDASHKLIARFVIDPDNSRYILNELTYAAYPTFYSSDPAVKSEVINDSVCKKSDLAVGTVEQPVGDQILKRAISQHPSMEKQPDKSCGNHKSKIVDAMVAISSDSISEDIKFATCLAKLKPFRAASMVIQIDQVISFLAPQREKIVCTNELPSGRNAAFSEKHGISLRQSWLDEASQDQVEKALFHETLHKVLSATSNSDRVEDAEIEVADLEDCCSVNFDPTKPSCQRARNAKPSGGTSPNDGKRVVNPTVLDGSNLKKGLSGEPVLPTFTTNTNLLSVAPMTFQKSNVSNRQQARELARRSEPAIKKTMAAAREVGESIDRNILKKIEPNLISRAQAAEPSTYSAQPRVAGAAPISQSSGETTRPTNNSAPRESESSGAGRTSSFSGGSSSTSGSEPITGTANTFNKNGTPKTLKLSNGMEVPSITAFANVKPDAISLAANSEGKQSDVTPTSVDAAAYTSAPRLSAPKPSLGTSIDGGESASSAKGGHSGGGGSSSGGGGPSDVSGSSGSGGLASAPSTGGTQSIPKEVPPENPEVAYSSVRSLPVRDMRDVATILRSTNTPGDLLKQKWFSKKLDWIGIQIVDHENVGYGSVKPKTRRTLDSILNPGAQRSPSSRGGK